MKVSYLLCIVFFFILVFMLGNTEFEQVKFFDNSSNVSMFDKVAPAYYEFGGELIEKPFYERVIEFVIVGPFRIFPNAPWIGALLVYGSVILLWLKWELIWSKIKKNSLFGKK